MRSKPSDAKLTALFLDMLAAEQGAGPNTLDAYRRDLTDFSEFLAHAGKGFTGAETEALRDYLASFRRPPEFAAFAADDPLPGVLDLPLVLSRLFTRRLPAALRRAV